MAVARCSPSTPMAPVLRIYIVLRRNDGANPEAGLILSGNTLYGTTYYGGGTNGDGTVFAVNTDGTGFTNLHSFTATTVTYPWTNSDGANPEARLILSGNTLYGTTFGGGSVWQWHGVRRQHRWHGFYEPLYFHGNTLLLFILVPITTEFVRLPG